MSTIYIILCCESVHQQLRVVGSISLESRKSSSIAGDVASRASFINEAVSFLERSFLSIIKGECFELIILGLKKF